MNSFLRLHTLAGWFLLALGAALCSGTHLQAADAPKPVVFPQTTSYNLEKDKVTLPADLAGPLNLLLLGFEREQQKDIDTWIPAAHAVQATHPDFHYYALPVFPRLNILSRWWMNSSMRSDAPNGENFRWTVPLYVNKPRFLENLQIRSEKEITVLLVDKTGKVLWRSAGPLSDEKKASLMASLGAVPSGSR